MPRATSPIARWVGSSSRALFCRGGDIDRDGRVDGRDLVFLGLAFGAGPTSRRFDADADLDGSGQVDGEDLAILAANFGASV